MSLDDKTPISDRKNEIIEGTGTERLGISMDNGGEMMDVDFGGNDSFAESDQEDGANVEAPMEVVEEVVIKRESTANMGDEGHLPRMTAGVSAEASDSHAVPRVGADPNEKHMAGVYIVQHKLHLHEIQSGTIHTGRRTNP